MAVNESRGPRLGLALAVSLTVHAALWWWQPVEPPNATPGSAALQVSLLSVERGPADEPPSSEVPEDDAAPTEAVADTEPTKDTAPPPQAEPAPAQPAAMPEPQPAPRPETVTRTVQSDPQPRTERRNESRPVTKIVRAVPQDSSESASMADPTADAAPEPARILANPKPDYPRQARRRGLEGQVLLEVEVRVDGRPGRIDIVASSGHAVLDRAALEGLRQWRFRPARRGGQAVEATLRVPVSFRLN